jgi:hypothetical protein
LPPGCRSPARRWAASGTSRQFRRPPPRPRLLPLLRGRRLRRTGL